MNALFHVLAPFEAPAGDVVVYAVASLAGGIVAFAVASAIVRWWKPLDAAARYAVWYVTLAVVAVGPLVAVSVASRTVPAVVEVRTVGVAGAPHVFASAPAIALPPAPIRMPPAAALAVAGAWLLVVLGGAVRFASGVLALSRLRRDALPIGVELRERLPLWRTHAPRRTRLCVSDRVDVPVAVGLADAMIVVPERAIASFDPADIDRFVLHEIAHLRRRDAWTAALQRVLQTILFFNPVVHAIARRLDLEREIACDDCVVAATADARSYAVGLTRMAESAAWPRRGIATPAIFVSRAQLSVRVEELLARRPPFASRAAVVPAAAAFVASLGIVAAAATFAPPVRVADASRAAPRYARIIMFTEDGKAMSFEANDARVTVIDDKRAVQAVKTATSPAKARVLLRSLLTRVR